MHYKFLFALLSLCAMYSTRLQSTAIVVPTGSICQNVLKVTYKAMDKAMFQSIVVGNTIIGITRQSRSPYMLYFEEDGSCQLWKKDHIYNGTWWIEKDNLGRDCVRAMWPEYTSTEPNSLFHPQNPLYGRATSVWYYVDIEQPNAIHMASRRFRSPVLLAPGKAFPRS